MHARRRKYVKALLLVCAVFVGSCQTTETGSTSFGNADQNEDPTARRSPVVKIIVTGSGYILLDGRRTTPRQLSDSLRKLKGENGAVWFHRENPEADPTPEVGEVMRGLMAAIAQNKVPARMFLKPDFSK